MEQSPHDNLFTDRDGTGRPIPSQELIQRCIDGQVSEHVKRRVDAAIDMSGAATKNLAKVLLRRDTGSTPRHRRFS